MSEKLISIDLGSKNIHIVVGRYQHGSLELEKALLIPTPDDAIKDGKIENIDSLKEILKSLSTQNRIKTKKAVIVTQSTAIITRDLVLPTIKQEELNNMVRFEIEQYLPIVSSEYIIEYTCLEEFQENNVNKTRIRVAAMPKNTVENYYHLLKDSGLKPVALDIHPNSVSKLFSNTMMVNEENYSTDKTIALIDFGYQSINVHLIAKGKMVFSRMVNLGARDLDIEISQNLNLTLAQAEEKKIKEGFLELREFETNDPINDLIRERMDGWINEIQKIFQYYMSRHTGNLIDGIYVYGGGSKIKGLEKYMEQFFNLKTKKINKLGCVKIKNSANLVEFSPDNYINALGGMIRYE